MNHLDEQSFIVYKTTNLINNKIYIGVHFDRGDDYLGSGVYFQKALKKYGRNNFKREILFRFDSYSEAYQKEREIVDEKFLARTDVYNMVPGGEGFSPGYVNVYEGDNIIRIPVSDERYSNGSLKSLTIGTSVVATPEGLRRIDKTIADNMGYEHMNLNKRLVKDESGNNFLVDANDDRLLSGELLHFMAGGIIVKDIEGNRFRTARDDVRLITGEISHYSEGIATAKTSEGKYIRVACSDKRLISGELKGTTSGQATVRDIDGNTFNVEVGDPRILSGELTHINKGKIRAIFPDGTSRLIYSNDERLKTGEAIHATKGKGGWRFPDGKIRKLTKLEKEQYVSNGIPLIGVRVKRILFNDQSGNTVEDYPNCQNYLDGKLNIKEKN